MEELTPFKPLIPFPTPGIFLRHRAEKIFRARKACFAKRLPPPSSRLDGSQVRVRHDAMGRASSPRALGLALWGAPVSPSAKRYGNDLAGRGLMRRGGLFGLLDPTSTTASRIDMFVGFER